MMTMIIMKMEMTMRIIIMDFKIIINTIIITIPTIILMTATKIKIIDNKRINTIINIHIILIMIVMMTMNEQYTTI